VQTLETGGRLLFLDAATTLARFVTDGSPDWRRFELTIEAVVGKLTAGAGLRAYGEMVGLLWEQCQYSAAIVLEEYWNRLLQKKGFSLYCSYPIDIFDKEFQEHGVDVLLRDHSHLLPSTADGYLDSALNRAIDEYWGSGAENLRHQMSQTTRVLWGELPPAEAAVLWLRSNASGDAEKVISLAHHHYRNSQRAGSTPA
jgi:hypothetical protein